VFLLSIYTFTIRGGFTTQLAWAHARPQPILSGGFLQGLMGAIQLIIYKYYTSRSITYVSIRRSGKQSLFSPWGRKFYQLHFSELKCIFFYFYSLKKRSLGLKPMTSQSIHANSTNRTTYNLWIYYVTIYIYSIYIWHPKNINQDP